jgi:hypothetical protein
MSIFPTVSPFKNFLTFNAADGGREGLSACGGYGLAAIRALRLSGLLLRRLNAGKRVGSGRLD